MNGKITWMNGNYPLSTGTHPSHIPTTLNPTQHSIPTYLFLKTGFSFTSLLKPKQNKASVQTQCTQATQHRRHKQSIHKKRSGPPQKK
jgi:hypothetical protein